MIVYGDALPTFRCTARLTAECGLTAPPAGRARTRVSTYYYLVADLLGEGGLLDNTRTTTPKRLSGDKGSAKAGHES